MSFGCFSTRQTNNGLADTTLPLTGRGKLQQLQDHGRYVLASTAPPVPDASMRGQCGSLWRQRDASFSSPKQHPIPIALSKDLHDTSWPAYWVPPSQTSSMECLVATYSGEALQTMTYAPQLAPVAVAGPPPPPDYAPTLAARTAWALSDEAPPPLPPQEWPETSSHSFTSIADASVGVECRSDSRRRNSDAMLSLPPGSRLAEQLATSPGEVIVRNTFIDGGLNLKQFIQQGRQVHSCPGSRLTTPRGNRSGRPGIGSPRTSPEVVSSTASTADTSEAMPDHEGVATHAFIHIAPTVPSQIARMQHGPSLPTPQVLNLEEVLDLAPPAVDTKLKAAVLAESESRRQGLGRHMTRHEWPAKHQLGSPELPSLGSIGHHAHRCKPCAFNTRSACANGVQCSFCHLCGHGEKKRRRKEKRSLVGANRKLLEARTEFEKSVALQS